jgi:hypothetical protein
MKIEKALEYRILGSERKFTYRDLHAAIELLTDAERDQSVQILPNEPDGEKPIRLEPVVAIDSIERFEVSNPTHSADDFQHHPEQIVLLSDFSPYSEDGDSWYELLPDGKMRGDKTGKIIDVCADIE